MTNSAKKDLFSGLLIAEGIGFLGLLVAKYGFHVRFSTWVYVGLALLYFILRAGERYFSKASEEDEKYGRIE